MKKLHFKFITFLCIFFLWTANLQAWDTMPARTNDTPDFVYTPSPEDWRSISIYQIITDRFFDGDPQNNDDNPEATVNPSGPWDIHGGDFEGLEQKLDYLKYLGMDAVWISPIVRNVKGAFHGFAASDFNQVDPHWGTLEDLRSMIDAAHERDMYVIIDVVQNHMGDRVGSSDSGYPSFNSNGYTLRWHNESLKHGAPFDDLSKFYNYGDIANWGNTTESILGDFMGLDSLRTTNSQVRSDLKRIYKGMIAATDCDGFRVDTARHVEMDFWEDFLPEIYDYAASIGKSNFFVYCESWLYSDSAVGQFTASNRFNSALYFPMLSTIEDVFFKGHATSKLNDRIEQLNNYDPIARYQLVSFMDNHDMSRALSPDKLNDDQDSLKVALAFLYTSLQVPCLYYGTEQGFNGETDPKDREDMFDGEYEWGPSLGDNFDPLHELFLTVRKLNILREKYPALMYGTFQERWVSHAGSGLFVFERSLDNSKIFVALNTSASEQTSNYQGVGAGTGLPNGSTLVNVLDSSDTLSVGTMSGNDQVHFKIPGKSYKIYVVESELKDLRPSVEQCSVGHTETIATSASITIDFDQNMSQTSVETGLTFVPSVTGQFVWSNDTSVTFTPTDSFSSNTTYQLSLAATASGDTGETLGAPFELQFNVGEGGEPPIEPPPSTNVDVFVMDGEVDDNVPLLEENSMVLYGAYSASNHTLYVATYDAGEGNDHFIYVTDDPTAGTQAAPWGKSGNVYGRRHYLVDENDNNFAGWFVDGEINGSKSVQSYTKSSNGGYLEGTMDLLAIFGTIPEKIYLAVAPYGTGGGSPLLDAYQVPSGNGNWDVDTNEYYVLDLSIIDSDSDGLYDLTEDANRNGQVDAGETNPFDADTDDDGVNDGDEIRNGTDPLVRDNFHVNIIFSNDLVTVSWPTADGSSYKIEHTDKLDGDNVDWTSLTPSNSAGTGNTHFYPDMDSSNGNRRFYRVIKD